jgi:hypothetical protein
MKRILVTGAGGRIGSWLLPSLRQHYGDSNVLATDVRHLGSEITEPGPFQLLDATDAKAVGRAVMRHDADTVYHLAAILSAVGESDPRLAWHVNMASLESVLDVAREQRCAVFTVELLREEVGDGFALFETVFGNEIIGSEKPEEVGVEDEMVVEIGFGLVGQGWVIQMVKCHTRIAFDCGHGRFVREILGSMIGDVGGLFEAEHPGELFRIVALKGVDVGM